MTAGPQQDLSEAVLRPVRGHHAFEACVEQLARAIRLGVYPVGSALPPERQLAGRLAVSRATLREAMAALRQAGLVETTRGRGGGTVVTGTSRSIFGRKAARVTEQQRRDWLDSLEYRRIVEPGAAYLAAERTRTEEAHARLDDAFERVSRDPAGSRRDRRQADSRFHLTIAALSQSPRVVESVASVQAALHEMLGAIPVLDTNIAHSDRQHRSLYTAVRRNRPDPARRVMEEHCDDTAALLRGLLG